MIGIVFEIMNHSHAKSSKMSRKGDSMKKIFLTV